MVQTGTNDSQLGYVSSHNILCQSYTSHNVEQNSAHSCFHLFLDEPILWHVQHCTETQGKEVKGDSWNLSIDELELFLGLVIACGIVGSHTMPLLEFWSGKWGNKLFTETMSRDRFFDILQFLYFDQ